MSKCVCVMSPFYIVQCNLNEYCRQMLKDVQYLKVRYFPTFVVFTLICVHKMSKIVRFI